jgi:hypothetical protein
MRTSSSAAQLVVETGKPIAQVARDLGINEGTWATDAPRSVGRGKRTAAWMRMSGPSLSGSVARRSSCRCSVMSSSGRWPSGWTRRWAGSRCRVHRRPEGRLRDPARDELPGAVSWPGVVLQVAARSLLAPACPAGTSERGDHPVVRGASRHLRVATDHRGPAGAGWRVSENTVGALMRELGLASHRPRRRRQTTPRGRGSGGQRT